MLKKPDKYIVTQLFNVFLCEMHMSDLKRPYHRKTDVFPILTEQSLAFVDVNALVQYIFFFLIHCVITQSPMADSPPLTSFIR